ncbi:glutathione peroxidase [Dyadobacter jejuensis]|nr:glutathione peroxidase [Dyadobacter jejuensis]
MIASLFAVLFADKGAALERPSDAPLVKQTFYDFKVKTLVGDQLVDLGKYKGKKVVILNVASKCGYTKQYADWEEFNKNHGDKVVVLGFPSNNFGGQEPGSAEEIATFCSKTYGVTFPMFEKVEVVGDNQAPLYKWLSTKELNGWNDKSPSWNFCKYVINEKGELTNFFASKILPTDQEFLKAVNL